MLLYDPASGRQLLARRVGEMAYDQGAWTVVQTSPLFERPDSIAPISVTFSDAERPIIELSGFEQTRTDDQLDVTLVWRALVDQPVDYVRFVHVLDATTGRFWPRSTAFRTATATRRANGSRVRWWWIRLSWMWAGWSRALTGWRRASICRLSRSRFWKRPMRMGRCRMGEWCYRSSQATNAV